MSFCGTGGWNGPLPGDPDNNSILSATPAFGGIDVSYSYPTTNAHAVAHALLYRGLTPVFGEAITSVVMPGNTYYDKVDSANQYYYWIRIVSTNGTVGDPIGPATAVARPLIQDLIVQLTGQIDSGVLAQSLKADLDKITLNYGEMIDEIANRVQGDAALSAALANVQEGLVNALAFIDSEVTARMTSQGALIEQVDTVAALNQQTAALVSQVQTAMVEGQNALSERIDLIAVTSEAAGAAAAIDEQRLASIARDDALALAITSAEARIGDDVAQVETTLSTNVNLVGDKVNAIGALYTAKVKVNGLIGGFGVYNDGTEVQAGFDVDNFWIGRTGALLKKPFMVIGNETFIDQAAINELVITKLRDESGRLVMENGSLAIRNTLGEIIFSAGRALDWNYVGGATKPQDGATRNMYRGPWTYPESYTLGDLVTDSGSSWTCIQNHTSSVGTAPPVFPTESNFYWSLISAKGIQGEEGVDLSVRIESTNGTTFRVGEARTTNLIARVFRNAVDVTDTIDANKFKWLRVSLDPKPSPNDDATWNSLYAQGYKQIMVSVDDVHAKATFHCHILQ